MRKLTALAAAVAALAVCTAPAGATDYFVTVGSDDFTSNFNCTLREALFAATNNTFRDACPAGSAASADVIQLIGGYSWTLGTFTVNGGGELVIRGVVTPPFTTLIDLGDLSRFLSIFDGADVTLESLNVRDGNAIAHFGNQRGGFVYAIDSALTLRNVNVVSSRANEGGAVYFASNGPSLLVERCQLTGNVAENGAGQVVPRGGALHLQLEGTASARVTDTRIADNEARSTLSGGHAQGGGMYAYFDDQAVVDVQRVEVDGNVAAAGSGGISGGAGAMLTGFGAARTNLADTTWTDNDLQGVGGFGSALWLGAYGTGSSRVDRARFVGNDLGQSASQLYLEAVGQSTLVASSILVADGSDFGLRGYAGQSSTLRIGHATIVGAATGAALQTAESGVIRVESSLFWDNDSDVIDTVPSALDPSTMTGVDPSFVSPATGDYALGPGSPAVDFGNRLLPSVGPFDLDHAPRVVGAQTDAGAYERGGLFADGLESGDAGAWSAASP
jgi:hypothetical protein